MIASELRERITQYVDNALSLEELEEWLIPRLPIYARESDSEDANAVATIELGLAELSEELFTEEQLREQLQALLNRMHSIKLPSPFEDMIVTTSRSSNETLAVGSEGFRLEVNLTAC